MSKTVLSLIVAVSVFSLPIVADGYRWQLFGHTRDLRNPRQGCEDLNKSYGFKDVAVGAKTYCGPSKYMIDPCYRCFGRN